MPEIIDSLSVWYPNLKPTITLVMYARPSREMIKSGPHVAKWPCSIRSMDVCELKAIDSS